MANVVRHDEIASRNKSELKEEFIAGVRKFRP
jgi:hypothetical protein